MGTTPIKKHYTCLIIGGGIVGAGILRDLALHGVSALLVEKGDFNAQTSMRSSKMLHGGIRYLENLDFALVQEALEEKNLWLKLAPHVCHEAPFHLPNYTSSKHPFLMVRAGMFLYDFLSHFQNKPSYSLNAKETLKQFPLLEEKGLKGSAVYFDGIVDDAKLGLECIYDALFEKQVQAANYTEVLEVKKIDATHYQVVLKDTLTGEVHTTSCEQLIVAAGPFTDQLMNKLNIVPWTPKLALSKGIHLWLKPEALKVSSPMVVQTKDNRVIFIIPQRHNVLVGTTETPVTEEIYNIEANQHDITYLLKNLAEFFPKANLSEKDITSSFAGVRPLAREDGQGEGLGKISRVHKIYRPQANLHVIVGGKYTTFRRMAQDLCLRVMKGLNKPYFPHLTLSPLRQRSLISTFQFPQMTDQLLHEVIKNEHVRTSEDLILRRFSVANESMWPGGREDFSQWKKKIEEVLPTVRKTH